MAEIVYTYHPAVKGLGAMDTAICAPAVVLQKGDNPAVCSIVIRYGEDRSNLPDGNIAGGGGLP